LERLPDTFWERSQFSKPRDREVVCHASAWNLDAEDDLRIKMCIKQTYDELRVIYHELGHNYYQRAYNEQPMLFRDGAHGGFHEAIGDTVTLSMTPEYLAEVGLIASAEQSEQAVINRQMQQALDKIAFLPFGKLIDEWRWGVFSGEISPDNYNAAWWELREKYQGIEAPVERTEANFDPGAKYHVPGNVSYTRYFLARIMQFQFQRALCDVAGHEGPLHECSIYGSNEAGARLNAMLEAGSSKPWPDTLEKLTGTREMDATAIIDYFAPLMSYLKEQNEGRTCGW
jgi:peptidyl-dipeptidase A